MIRRAVSFALATVIAPAFTGTQFDNRAAYIQIIACKKDAAAPMPFPVISGVVFGTICAVALAQNWRRLRA